MATAVATECLVLDSWPLLEWIKGREPTYSAFISLIQQAIRGEFAFHISRINYGEAIYSIRKAADIADTAGALRKLASSPITVHSVDDKLVDQAVDLKSVYAFSYADAFAAALAMRLAAPLVTGDSEFRALEASQQLRLRWVGA